MRLGSFYSGSVVRTVGFTGVYILWKHMDLLSLKHFGCFYETGNVVFFYIKLINRGVCSIYDLEVQVFMAHYQS